MPARTCVSGIIIDGLGTPDPDDAIGIKQLADGFLLTISITDLSKCIAPQGRIFERALRQGSTIYNTSNGHIFMFPEQLVTGQLCLSKGRRRKALAMQFLLSPEFQPKSRHITLGYLKAKDQLTYLQAGEILEDPSHPRHSELRQLSMAARSLYRLRSGDSHARWLPRQKDTQAYLEKRGLLHAELKPCRIIEEMMIAFNLGLAEYSHAVNLPFIYRVHENRLAVTRAYYTTRPDRHEALGAQLYAHGTSPLRRIADYLNQLQVVPSLLGQRPTFNQSQLEGLMQRVRAV